MPWLFAILGTSWHILAPRFTPDVVLFRNYEIGGLYQIQALAQQVARQMKCDGSDMKRPQNNIKQPRTTTGASFHTSTEPEPSVA